MTHVTVSTSATALFASSAVLASAAQTHILQPGETLSAVARRYHVSIHDLKVANKLADVDNVPDFKHLIIPPRPRHLRLEPSMERAGKAKADRVSLRLGPDESYRRIEFVDIGTHLTITAMRDGWAQVRLESGAVGWLRQDFVAESGHHANNTHHHAAVAHAEDEGRHSRHSHHTEVAVERHASKHVRHEHSAVVQAHTHRRHLAEAAEGRHHRHVAAAERGHRPHHSGEIASAKRHHIHLASAHHHNGRSTRAAEASGDIVRTAFAYRGTPYVYGGAGRGGFDCSGFTRYLYSRRGVSLPHSARGQFEMGHHIGRGNLKPGDLVFFHTVTPGISHVGMYIGNGRFVHASSRRTGGVRVDSLSESYYSRAFRGARRILK